MSGGLTIEALRFEAGRFRARLKGGQGDPEPSIHVRLRGRRIAEAMLTLREQGVWDLEVGAPAEAFSDGCVVLDFVTEGGERLAAYPVAAGAALEGDLVAEIASLRAELDLLKRAFREALAGGVIARAERPLIVAEALTKMEALLDIRERTERDALAFAPEPDADEEEPPWAIRE